MRVLLVTAYFAPHVGGVERFVEHLAAELARRGHDVVVLTTRTDRRSPTRESRDGYRVRRVPAANAAERRLGVPYPVPDPHELARALRDELARADVVHVQDVLYATSAAAILAARVPTLVTLHVGFVPQRHRVLDAVERAALRAAGSVARRAARVVSYNPAVARWAEEAWGLRSVDVLPVGVEAPSAPRDRGAFGLPEDRFVALFVGRDVAKKNLDVFAAATDPAYELVAVTDGRRDGLRTLPFMPPERFHRLLASVDAFVLPSRAEGIPLALQEAMAAGLPVVTTMQPGYERYLTEDDVLAVEAAPAAIRAALRRLASDEALRDQLAARSRAVAAREFAVAAFVDAYERAYRSISPST